MNEEFWTLIDKLVEQSEIVIDRPKGSTHPRYANIVYELDYGHLRSTRSPDGDGIDVWLGSNGKRATAVVCTVDLVKRDSEIKILLGCTADETRTVYEFHNRTDSMKGILINR